MVSLEKATCLVVSQVGSPDGKRRVGIFTHRLHRSNHCLAELTSEEVREKRRAERKQFKLDRAKAIATLAAEAEAVFEAEGRVIVPPVTGPQIPSGATWRPTPSMANNEDENQVPDEQEPLEDVEHLQLTLQEAFFLIWNFDCLTVMDPYTVATSLLFHPLDSQLLSE